MSSELDRPGASGSDRPSETSESTGAESRPVPKYDAGNTVSRLESFARRDAQMAGGVVEDRGFRPEDLAELENDGVPRPGDPGHVPVPDRGRPAFEPAFGSGVEGQEAGPGDTVRDAGDRPPEAGGPGTALEGAGGDVPDVREAAADSGTALLDAEDGADDVGWWPEPSGGVDVRSEAPGPGLSGTDDFGGRFAPGLEGGFEDGQDLRGPDGFDGGFGRPRDGDGEGTSEVGGYEEGKDARGNARPGDTSQSAERAEGGPDRKTAEGEDRDAEERTSADQVRLQQPVSEAETDRPAEASAEASPDQKPDDPRLAAMEARMAEFASMFESVQARLEASENRNEELEARLDASQARNEELEAKVGGLETGRQEDQAKIRQLEARAEEPDAVRQPDGTAESSEQTESLLNPDVTRPDDESDDSALEQADVAAFARREDDRDSREAEETLQASDRPGFSEDTAQAGKDALSLAGSLGIVNPVVSLAVSADSARRNFQKMEPADQLDVINLTDAATKAFGSMPPAYAVVAVALGTVAPLAGDKIRNAIHHVRRKD